MRLDWPRVVIYLLGAVLGSCAAIYLRNLFVSGEDLQNFFVVVYSILVGFLVAVLAVLLDPGVILRGTWRIAHLQREEMIRRFTRHIFLFYSYLISLAFILVAKLHDSLPCESWEYIGGLAAFTCVASFVWSFDLPISLFNIQRDKFDAIVAARSAPEPPKS